LELTDSEPRGHRERGNTKPNWVETGEYERGQAGGKESGAARELRHSRRGRTDERTDVSSLDAELVEAGRRTFEAGPGLSDTAGDVLDHSLTIAGECEFEFQIGSHRGKSEVGLEGVGFEGRDKFLARDPVLAP